MGKPPQYSARLSYRPARLGETGGRAAGARVPLHPRPRLGVFNPNEHPDALGRLFPTRQRRVDVDADILPPELVRLGHRVTIVAPDYGTPEDDAEFEIVRLPARRIFFDPEDRLIARSAARAIVDELACRTWDVIHIHTPFRAQPDRRCARAQDRPADRRELSHVFRGVRRELPAVVSAAAAALLRAAFFEPALRKRRSI